MSNQLVKDYKGNLIPKIRARKISGAFYEEEVSCFLMPDGQWYRIDSPKLVYDNYTKKYILKSTASLVSGIINETGEIGSFSSNPFMIELYHKRGGSSEQLCLNEEIATKLGYVECISDGCFYLRNRLTDSDMKTWMILKDIPKSERSSDYNLENNPEKKAEAIRNYENSQIPIGRRATFLSRFLGDLTFGMEVEVINGFIPRRIRNIYGLKALKDGSLRHDGGEGIEYVTMPMRGAKGVQTIINVMKEFSKRCEINNYCSLHYHFGNVRRDKAYVISLWRTIRLIQNELQTYFPYSRFNSIKSDGKVYCKPLEGVGLNVSEILSSTNQEDYRKNTVKEFNKIYSWLNNGKQLAEEFAPAEIVRDVKVIGGKKMFADSLFKQIFTTKVVHHAVTGNKWDKATRYTIVNFLNLFFNNIGTIEFRCHESTTSAHKAIVWLLVCASILKFAEDIERVYTAKSIKLEDILKEHLPQKMVVYIMEYMQLRNKTFFTPLGSYREGYKNIETNWFTSDPDFTFTASNNYKLL